jgi:hypothetical protein
MYLISFLHSITLSIFYPHLSTCIIDIPDSFHHPNPLLKDHVVHYRTAGPRASAPRQGLTGGRPAILAARRLTPTTPNLPTSSHEDPSRRWPALVAPPLAIAQAAAPSARRACGDGAALH